MLSAALPLVKGLLMTVNASNSNNYKALLNLIWIANPDEIEDG
jgi:hypothetical protein